MREGEVVDIEVDSGAEVSCLPAIIGADTYTLHEMRLSMVGGHHVAAGGGKLHELGARILGLEAGDVRGDVVNLLVRSGWCAGVTTSPRADEGRFAMHSEMSWESTC